MSAASTLAPRAPVIPIAVARELRALRQGGAAAMRAASVLRGALEIINARDMRRAGSTAYSEYRLLWWGEIIGGTKAEIRAFGIAVDTAFPGEPGARKWAVKVSDPRGLDVVLEPNPYLVRGDPGQPIYSAQISYPGPAVYEDEPWRDHSPGVRFRELRRSDEYSGAQADLVAAGLARDGQFPGQPGMRRTVVTILPDGRAFDGPATATHPLARAPGARVIERAGKHAYRVRVNVPGDVAEERCRQMRARDDERRRWYERQPRRVPLRGPLSPQLDL
jgi:hypothetical protein